MSTEQEYDAHADMLDEDAPADANEEIVAPDPYQAQFGQQPQQQPPDMRVGAMQQGDPNAQAFDPFDPMLDADPFGLTASMHFPTPFSFQESAMRR